MLKIYHFNFLKNLAIFLGSAKKWSVLKRTKTKHIGFRSFFIVLCFFYSTILSACRKPK